jgi:hypothetical protein
MTDSALIQLLHRGSLRMRWQHALRVGLAALGLAFGILAAVVLALRWAGNDAALVQWLLVPAAGAVLAALGTGVAARADLPRVAALVDLRARTHEMLTTWLSLRDSQSADDLRDGFKRAQAAATFQTAAALRVRDLLPWSLPVWHRAVWLALIMLLSALLMPARRVDDTVTESLQRARANGSMANPGAASGESAKREAEPLRVQVLAPAQLRKLQLMATDTELPPALKAQALDELLKAIGSVPESALTQDVREILELLRKDARAPAAETKNDGNASAADAPATAKARAVPSAAQFDPLTAGEQARTAVAARFPDVEAELLRYYQTFKK